MDIYDSDNCATFKYHIDLGFIFSASDAFVLRADITTILFNCKSSSVYNICGTRFALITNDVQHYFTNTGSDEHCNFVDPFQSPQPDTTTGNSCQISAIPADIFDANEIKSTSSIGGCVTATATTTTATTTTATKRHNHITACWGGG